MWEINAQMSTPVVPASQSSKTIWERERLESREGADVSLGGAASWEGSVL